MKPDKRKLRRKYRKLSKLKADRDEAFLKLREFIDSHPSLMSKLYEA